MNRRPDLIAPVLIVAFALIVMGGIATGLSQTGDPGATAAFPIALQENETTVPTTGTGTVETTVTTTVETTGTGVETTGTTPAVNTTGTTPTTTGAGADWALPNGDMANTRALDGSGSTVTGLSEGWTATIETGSMANPIIVGNTVFVQDSSGTTYAFDRTTGDELWRQSDYAGGNQTTGPTVSPTGTATETPTGTITVEPTGGAGNQTLVEVAVAEPDLSTLVTALTEADLDVALNGTGMYTVFAPNNAAFEALPEGALDALLANQTALADVLTYHVVSGLYPAEVLRNTTSLVTLQGQTLNVTQTADAAIMVNDATVVQADLQATNGVIHVIDAVLLPMNATPAVTPTANETATATVTETGTAALQQARKLPVLGQEGNQTTEPTTIATTDGEENETPTVTATATANETGTPTAEPTGSATVSPTETSAGGETAGNATFEGPHGPVAGDGRVYVPVAPASLAALDQATGDVLWTTALTADPNMVIAMQPSFANGLVYVSTSPGPDLETPEGGSIGTFYAVDAASGQVRWEFLTVDSAEIWGNPDVNSGGGGRYSPAFDGTSLYWSTSGPNPAPGTRDFPNAGSRPGPNLWTNGIGVIDAASGAPGWFTQAIPADIYGQGFFVPPVLANATVQNQTRDLVIGAGEDGRVIAFDRTTGAILWTSTVGRHENDRLERFPDAGITAWPGALGGVSTPMACADGYVYVASVELPTSYFPWGIGSTPDLADARGMITAINLSTGRTGWQDNLDSAPTGGATVVGDAVIVGTYDGRIHVHDRTTGEMLAERFLAGPITSTPAVAGDLLIWQAGTGGNARVFALTLEGVEVPTSPTPTVTTTVTGTATAEPTGTITVEPTGGAENQTLVEVAASEPDLTTLVTAVTEAGLVGALNGTEVYTVFAPNNAAFEALPEGALDDLLANQTALTDVLTYHVVPGLYPASDLGSTTTLVTLEGQTLNISLAPGGGVMVNGATVVQADLQATNGIIHVIDAVLLPPAANETATVTPTPIESATAEPTPTAESTVATTGTETAFTTGSGAAVGSIPGTFSPAVPGETKAPLTSQR